MLDDNYIKGIFTGMLLAFFLAYLAPQTTSCMIKVDYGKFVTVTVGELR